MQEGAEQEECEEPKESSVKAERNGESKDKTAEIKEAEPKEAEPKDEEMKDVEDVKS